MKKHIIYLLIDLSSVAVTAAIMAVVAVMVESHVPTAVICSALGASVGVLFARVLRHIEKRRKHKHEQQM